MSWITLEDLRFHAAVGVTEVEKTQKNDISVDLSVKVDTHKASKTDKLEHTIDYAELYKLVSDIVLKGSNLLETVSAEIGESLLRDYKDIEEVRIKIHKLNPPIGGECGRATIKMRFRR